MPEFWETDPISNAAQSQAVAADWWSRDPVAAPAAPEQPETWGEYGKGLLQKVGQGATFNFGDELAAGAGAIGNKVIRAVGFDVPEKSYSDILTEVRAPEKKFEERHPYQAVAAEVAGGLSTLAAGPARTIMSAPAFMARARQSAKVGAAYGATAGFGRGEGVGDRVAGGVEGGLTGAVLGPVATEVAAPAIGALVRGTRATGQGIGNAVQFVRGKRSNPDARLYRALEKQNMTPQQAQAALDEAQSSAKFGKTQLDPRFTLADTGPVAQDLADTASLVSGKARGEAGDFLVERARGGYDRINDYLRRSMKVTRTDFAKTKTTLLEEQQRLSKTAYDAFRKSDVRIPVGDVLYNAQIEDLAAAPALKKVLAEAREQFVAARGSRDVGGAKVSQAYTELTPARFDAGKRALDDMIDAAQRTGRNNEARLLTTLKNQLVKVADDATTLPGTNRSLYAEARDVYSSRAQLLDALEEGRAFMRGDSEVTGAQYKAKTTGEKRMFRIGVAREVRKALGAKRLGTDTISYFDRPNTRDVLEEIMTPKQAKSFYQLVELEQALAATNNAVRGNSKTALRQQNVLDFSLGVRLGRAIKDQGLRQALSNEIFDQITKAFAMREDDAIAVTRMLFETDPAAQRAILTRLAQNYGPKPARAIVVRAQAIARNRMLTAKRALSGAIGQQGAEVNLFGLAPQPQQRRGSAAR